MNQNSIKIDNFIAESPSALKETATAEFLSTLISNRNGKVIENLVVANVSFFQKFIMLPLPISQPMTFNSNGKRWDE